MKRLDLILNGKGGVGKSFFAVNFVQFLKDKAIAHIAIDSDNENSTLKRFHPDVQFLDLANRRELDGIFRSLERANLVVVDCRAASSELFLEYFGEVEAPAVLKALGAVLTLVMPVNHELDSVDQVQRLTDQLGRTCSYVVVRNAAHSDSFALYESTEVHAQINSELGGREIVMHRLQDWLVEALSRENLTITAATKHPFNPVSLPMDWVTNHPKQALLICGVLFVLVALWFLFVAKAKTCVARLGGLTWRRNQFCRGWLITGDTGSGKTSSGVNQLAHQVFQNEPTWGGPGKPTFSPGCGPLSESEIASLKELAQQTAREASGSEPNQPAGRKQP